MDSRAQPVKGVGIVITFKRALLESMPTGTIHKVVRILRFMADKGMKWNIRDFSSELKIPRSTVHRIFRTLAKNDILAFNPEDKKYHWGQEMIRISRCVYQGTEMRELALPILREIVDQCNETAILTLYDRPTRKIVFADQAESHQDIIYKTRIGIKLAIHAGASGKAILAFLPENEIEEIIASGLERVTDQTVVDPNRLRTQLAEIRRKGYAISRGERTAEAVGIACPVFDFSSHAIGSIIVTIPSYRFRTQMESRIRFLVKKGADHLSYLNGFRPGRHMRQLKGESPDGLAETNIGQTESSGKGKRAK
jgi:DNA-binding IclR family transcriptional regulator